MSVLVLHCRKQASEMPPSCLQSKLQVWGYICALFEAEDEFGAVSRSSNAGVERQKLTGSRLVKKGGKYG